MKLRGREKEENVQDSIHFLNTSWYLRKGSVMIAHGWNRWKKRNQRSTITLEKIIRSLSKHSTKEPFLKRDPRHSPTSYHLQPALAVSVQAQPVEATADNKPSLLVFHGSENIGSKGHTCTVQFLGGGAGGRGAMKGGTEVNQEDLGKHLQTHWQGLSLYFTIPNSCKLVRASGFVLRSPKCIVCLLCYQN